VLPGRPLSDPPESAIAHWLVDVAAGIIAESLKLDADTARQRLMEAAQRAGTVERVVDVTQDAWIAGGSPVVAVAVYARAK
jgi:hypothetical protein